MKQYNEDGTSFERNGNKKKNGPKIKVVDKKKKR